MAIVALALHSMFRIRMLDIQGGQPFNFVQGYFYFEFLNPGISCRAITGLPLDKLGVINKLAFQKQFTRDYSNNNPELVEGLMYISPG